MIAKCAISPRESLYFVFACLIEDITEFCNTLLINQNDFLKYLDNLFCVGD